MIKHHLRHGCKLLASATLLTLGTVAIAAPTHAQEGEPINANQAIDAAFFRNSRGFYESQSTFRRVREIFGTGLNITRRGNYPEIGVERDAALTNRVYTQLMQDQVANDPTLRVPDLPNPFNTSLLTAPGSLSSTGSQVVGTEFVYERLPLR